MAAKKKPAAKAVATVNSGELALGFDVENLPVNGGLEHTDQESFAIPFLRVLQKGSPQCEETEPEYMPEARPGMLFNTVSRALYASVNFIPCAFQRKFIRWAPRGAGQGFKGELSPEDVAVMKEDGVLVQLDGRWYFPASDGSVHEKKCDMVADTRNHFGLILNDDGSTEQCLLSLTSTQIKKSKQLISMLANVKIRRGDSLVTPPTWVSIAKIETVAESNDEGNWHGVRFTLDGMVPNKDVYDAGKSFHDAIDSGEANVNYNAAREDSAADHSGAF